MTLMIEITISRLFINKIMMKTRELSGRKMSGITYFQNQKMMQNTGDYRLLKELKLLYSE